MANLTLAIDDELLKRARIRALEEGTSVNAVVRDYLTTYATAETPQVAMRRFLELAATSDAGSQRQRDWTRDDLYEDRTP